MPSRQSKPLHAYRIFFPAAAAYAVVAVLLTVAMTTGAIDLAPGLVGVSHAHEMLFGFALALIAGYTLGPLKPVKAWSLLTLWLAARVGFVIAPHSLSGMALSPVFAVVLGWWVVPRFFAAKKWRNRMVSPLIGALCLLPVVWLVLPLIGQFPDHSRLMLSGIVLLALLMAFMGGRVMAPAVAGAFYNRGENLEARVQPRIEAGFIGLLPLAGVLVLFAPTQIGGGALLIVAALLIGVRLARWQLWRCPERPDLIGLGIGYAWLALGLVVLGVALCLHIRPVAFLHLITVGALGSLSTGIMARLHTQRLDRRPPATALVAVSLALIALATVARVVAGLIHEHFFTALWVSALSWAAAYGVLFVFLVQRRGAALSSQQTLQTEGVKP